MNNIGNRIRDRRIELGLTQQELADRLGYTSKSAISRIERGIADIPFQKAAMFAEALETSESYINGTAFDDSEASSEAKKELIDIIQSLPEEQAQGLLLGLKTTLQK